MSNSGGSLSKNLNEQCIKPEDQCLRKSGLERHLQFYLLSYWPHTPQSEHAISQNQLAVQSLHLKNGNSKILLSVSKNFNTDMERLLPTTGIRCTFLWAKLCSHNYYCWKIIQFKYRILREESTILQENVSYVKWHHYNKIYLYPNLNSYRDNGQITLYRCKLTENMFY